ncbi:MAG: PilZ domain-containing protein [Desulfobacterales bacterium]|jgi:c-di-GMP-binding flagellar brake protein YcgR
MSLNSFKGRERRAYVRLERSLPVRFKILAEQKGKTFTATTKNISRGGLCLEIQQDTVELLENLSGTEPKISINLDILIPPPDAAASVGPAWISSRVDWTRKPTVKNPVMLIGLEFEGVNDEARKRIHNYIVEEIVERYEEPN